MIIDGFFIKTLTKELNGALLDARLEKIGQLDQSSFLLNFYNKGKKYKLIINLYAHDYRCYFTEKKVISKEHSQFLVSLKKHLEGGIIQSVYQYFDDRVIIFDLKVSDFIFGPQDIKLILESMGKHANLMIVKDDVILDTFKKMFFEEGRQLIPQAHFEYFPTDKLSFSSIDYQSIDSPKALTSTYMGLSKRVSEYIYPKQLQMSDLEIKPTYDLDKNLFYTADIFDINHKKKYYHTLSELQDAYKIKKTISKSKYESFIDKQIKKLTIKENNLVEQYQKAENQLAIKHKGDLIYMSGLNLNTKSHEILVGDTKLLLDENLTLNENAQKFYKAYQKAKRSLDPILKQIEDNKQLLSLFNDFKTFLVLSTPSDLIDLEQDLAQYGFETKKQQVINKKHKRKPNILEIKDNNALYYIGKNSIQNAYVTHDLSNPNDYWFHVKDGAGSHVLVKTNDLSEHVIRKASMLAAYHSNLRYSSSIPVDYTQIKNIKKIPHKPGYQVIYKYFKTMFIDIDDAQIDTFLHSL